jgi:hypothetical protein
MFGITTRDIRNFQARYHRNGIMGEGFFACRFMFRDGNSITPMVAVVWTHDDTPGDIRCAVLALSDNGAPDINSKWRGDEFALALRQKIVAAGADDPMALHRDPEPCEADVLRI